MLTVFANRLLASQRCLSLFFPWSWGCDRKSLKTLLVASERTSERRPTNTNYCSRDPGAPGRPKRSFTLTCTCENAARVCIVCIVKASRIKKKKINNSNTSPGTFLNTRLENTHFFFLRINPHALRITFIHFILCVCRSGFEYTRFTAVSLQVDAPHGLVRRRCW